MKKLPLGVVLLAVVYFGGVHFGLIPTRDENVASLAATDTTRLSEAYANQRSDVQVASRGRVARILPDDRDGSRHQRFILRLVSGQTVLVAHNIDIADRIASLQVGDVVEFHGEYEWNARGGVIHWTHRDPQGRHIDGWLKHKGVTYD